MNKYIVKATAQIAAVLAFGAIMSLGTLAVLEYFQPSASQIIFTLVAGLLLYTVYNLIKIQASILESRDRLKE